MTKPKELKEGSQVKMVRNVFSEHFPDKDTPLGCLGKVLSVSKGALQPYFVVFDGFTSSWDPTSHVWYCARHELRKLPDRMEGA